MTRVALVSIGSADDERAWSGIPFHIKRTLTAMGVDVLDVSPLRLPAAPLRHRAFTLSQRVGRTYRYELDGGAIRAFARQAEREIAGAGVDAVISTSILPVSRMRLDVPVAVWCDATIDNLVQTYPEFRRVPARQLRNAREAETRVAQNADVLGYASPWAAASATGTFGADPGKIAIVPFGAGLEPPAGFDAAQAIAARDGSTCRLVWIGVDWERKRGAFCVDVARELHARGVDVRLSLVGAAPGSAEPLPDYVEHLGFVDKRTPGGGERLSALLADAHFVLLPSRAECFGIVIAEGNAHAVPCVAARVGGIPGAITEGENGHLLEADATAAEYADRIQASLAPPDRYASLAAGSFDAYRTRLNWTASCATLLARLQRPG